MGVDLLSLIIFGVCVVLYIINKCPKTLVALTGLTVMILFNVVSFSDAFKNFAGKTTILVCSTMIIGEAIINTGVAYSIGKKIIKLARNNERMLIIISTTVAAILSAFISNVAVYLFIFSILVYICKENKEINLLNVVIPVGMAAVMGSTITLVGGTALPAASGILEEYIGKEFHFFTTSLLSIIVNVILVLYAGFIGYPLGKKIWGSRSKSLNTDNQNINEQSVYKKKYFMIIILIATIIAFILSDKITEILPNVNIATISLVSAILCIISGCISYKNAIKSINWDIIIWLGATLGIATGLTKSGGSELISNFIFNLTGNGISPLLLYIIFVIFTVLATQFLSNTAAISLVFPIMCSITVGMGYNTYSFAIGVALAGTLGIATPLANNTMALVYTANYKFSDFIKYCLPVTVLEMIFLIIFVPILYPLA